MDLIALQGNENGAGLQIMLPGPIFMKWVVSVS